jgi:ribose-phosphate pyrophosphokinase
MTHESPLVFSTQSYRYLAEAICAHGGFPEGALTLKRFPDGERYMRIDEAINGRDIALVGGTIDDTATLELYDLACAFAKHWAGRITMIVPYYGYGTMERATRSGEVVVAKTRARLLSSVPPASHGNRVVLLDLHSEGVGHYFEGSLRSRHLYGRPIVTEMARTLGGDDFVLGSTDAGRAKWVQSLANVLGVEAAFVYKRRLDDSTTEVQAVSARVQGRRVVIYDDLIRTGGSLMGAGRAYLEAGASSLCAIATHGLFCGDSFTRIWKSGIFERIACTDSHPAACAIANKDARLEVFSVAPLFSAFLAAETDEWGAFA